MGVVSADGLFRAVFAAAVLFPADSDFPMSMTGRFVSAGVACLLVSSTSRLSLCDESEDASFVAVSDGLAVTARTTVDAGRVVTSTLFCVATLWLSVFFSRADPLGSGFSMSSREFDRRCSGPDWVF